tara:strand:+ start:176 stop:1057 length:882 start_codon:yes stop_codon:yes gene_type:complete
MLHTILHNLVKKLKLFLTNKNSNEVLSKIYLEKLYDKIKKSNVNQYALKGFKVYSQNDEDGIIESIFNDIGTTNKIFCEIGVGDCIENNTHYLLLKDWKGLWIDAKSKHIRKLKKKINNNQEILDLKIKKIDKSNINKIIKESIIPNYSLDGEIDFLSIDIDSYDLDCVECLDFLKPRLICIEYNAKFNFNLKLQIKKINNFNWQYDDYFGSSLGIINEKLENIGYSLIATNISGCNAFFVKKNLLSKCVTKDQNIEQLYLPPNVDLFNFNVAHAPSNKYLLDKLNVKKNLNS